MFPNDPTADPLPTGDRPTQLTAVAFPRTGQPDLPFRYLYPCRHTMGYTNIVVPTNLPLHHAANLTDLARMVQNKHGLRDVKVLAAIPLAGPLSPQLVMVSDNTARPYRYMITYLTSSDRVESIVLDLPQQITDFGTVENAQLQIQSRHGLADGIAIITLALIAGPAR